MSQPRQGEPVGCIALLVSIGALVFAVATVGSQRHLPAPASADADKDREALREEIRLVHEERMTSRKERLKAVAEELTEGDKRQYHRIALENRCRFAIAVALRYKDLDDATVSRGWWEVAAGASTVTDAMTRDGAFWVYAENQSVGRTWDGSGTEGPVDIAVSDEKFDQIEGEPVHLKTPRPVSFAKHATSTEWSDTTATFECPVEEAPPKGTIAKPPASGQGPRHR